MPTTTRRPRGSYQPTEAQRRTWARTPATERQIATIARLADERAAALVAAPDGLDERVRRARALGATGELSMLAASDCLDALMALPRPERVDDGQPRPNRYAGACVECEARVRAGAGHLVSRNGRWAVVHPECATEAAEDEADEDAEWESF